MFVKKPIGNSRPAKAVL